MADYKQFTVPLQTLKTDLAKLYDPKSKSYSDKFVSALYLLATLLEDASKQDKPQEYISSAFRLPELYSLRKAIKPYFDINLTELTLTYDIRSDFKIADEKMYLAIIKCKTFVGNMPDNSGDKIADNSGDKIADLKHGINTFFKDFFDIELARYELNKEFEVLSAKIKKDNEYFKKEYNEIERMLNYNADVTLIESAVNSFLEEQKITQNDNLTEHSKLLIRYADLYNDEEQGHLNDKKHNIEDYNSVPLLEEIARLKKEFFERSDEVSSFEETKERDPNDQQDTSLNVNISPLALAIAELNKAKEEYHEVNNELNRINEEILLLRKQQDETFSAADRALLSSKKQQLNEMREKRGQFFAIGCSLKEQFANLQKEQVDLNNKKASGYELLTYLEQVIELIKNNPFSFLVNKEKFEQMKEYFESSEQQQFGVIDDLMGRGKERRVFQTNMGVTNLLPTLRTKLFDKLSGISRRLIKVQSNVNKLNSKLRAEYNNNQEMQLEEYNTKIVNLELECKPLQEKNDEYEHLQQQLETLGLSREDISTRLVEKLEVFSEYKQKVSDIETEEQERNESIKEFLTVLKKLVHEIDEDESFDEDKRKKLLGQIAHKISYYQHHKNLFENRFYDTEDVSSKLDEIFSTLVKLGADFRTNFKKSTSAPSHSIFGNKRKAKAQEIEDLITRVNQLLNYTGDPLDSSLIVTYEKQLKKLSQYDSIPRYKDSINKAKLDIKHIKLRMHQIKYFGTEGEFEKYANGIRGCASALLGMIYTCLASMHFCFNYKPDIMFLDDLKKPGQLQKEINNQIAARVKNYPDSSLSKILKEYQTGLEQLTQEAEALNTPQADHGATL